MQEKGTQQPKLREKRKGNTCRLPRTCAAKCTASTRYLGKKKSAEQRKEHKTSYKEFNKNGVRKNRGKEKKLEKIELRTTQRPEAKAKSEKKEKSKKLKSERT